MSYYNLDGQNGSPEEQVLHPLLYYSGLKNHHTINSNLYKLLSDLKPNKFEIRGDKLKIQTDNYTDLEMKINLSPVSQTKNN